MSPFRSRKPPLYIALSQHKIWIFNQEESLHLEKSESPLDVEKILSICPQPGSKIILFLEFPWILSRFDLVPALSPQEAIQYSHSHLSFKEESSIQDIMGTAFFEQNLVSKEGLFYTQLSPSGSELIQQLKKRFKVKVETAPLIYSCLPVLLKHSSSSLLFQGLEQTVLLEKQEHSSYSCSPF